MQWKWISASEIGTSHLSNGTRLQDAHTVSALGTGELLAIVSDGAGSAKYGAEGAWLTCRYLKTCLREWFSLHQAIPTEETVLLWMDELRDKISLAAASRNTVSREFAATLTLLFVTVETTLVLQIGDSCVTARRDGNWEPLCWPENGEYASSTYFITDNPQVRLQYLTFSTEFDAYSLFTDGVGDLSLVDETKSAHSGFFEPMIRPVDDSKQSGHLLDLSKQLRLFLASQSVCDRTDDDKTLILISGT